MGASLRRGPVALPLARPAKTPLAMAALFLSGALALALAAVPSGVARADHEVLGARALVRKPVPPRRVVSLAESRIAAPFHVEADDRRDYRTPAATVLRYAGPAPWRVAYADDAQLVVSRDGLAAVRLAGPVLLVHPVEARVRLVTPTEEVILPCASSRHAREATRLLRRALLA